MKLRNTTVVKAPFFAISMLAFSIALAQPPGPGGRPQEPEVIPDPIVSPIPTITALTGPGNVYDSSAALWPGNGIPEHDYVVEEYRIAGTANNMPYDTRLVIRRPSDN